MHLRRKVLQIGPLSTKSAKTESVELVVSQTIIEGRLVKNTNLLLIALSAVAISSTVKADPWEPGYGVGINYAPSYELDGSSGNSMEGHLLGARLEVASGNKVPMRASLAYSMGSTKHRGEDIYKGVKADDSVLALELAAGYSIEGDSLEVIPFAGLGFREMRQSFKSGPAAPDNDIATSARKHRLFYLPLGFYVGSTSSLKLVNIYYSVTWMPVISGEAQIGGGKSSARMTLNNGYGLKLEAGFHVPTESSWNFVTGIFFEQWDLNSSYKGVRSAGGTEIIERETNTRTQVIGINAGVRF